MKTHLKNVSTPDGQQVDVCLQDHMIASLQPTSALQQAPQEDAIDATGYLLLPPLVDAHAHLDKTLWGMDWFHNHVTRSLQGCIDNERNVRLAGGLDPFQQASRLIEQVLSMGTLSMRSHVDVDTGIGLRGLEGVLAAREKYRDRLHLELVAFPQSGLLCRPGTLELMETALQMGADLVGGVDPAALDRDPKGCVDAIFRLAEKYGKPVDIHLHEPGELGAFTMELIAAHTIASGMQGKVTVSHAFCLGGPNASLVASLVEKVAKAGIQITTGGHADAQVPSVKQLTAAGVNICGGNDNIQDMWSPFGSGDMIERAQLIAMRNGFRWDEDLALALRVCTQNGAKLLGLPAYGVTAGGRADFVLVRARNVAECVATRPLARMVFQGGAMIAKDGQYLA